MGFIGFEPPLEPDEYPFPRCPICLEETDTFYKGFDGGIVGCPNCISEIDSFEEDDHDAWRDLL